VRAGEKLCEELSTDAEDADRTKHPKVFVGRIKPHDWNLVVAAVGNLLATTGSDDTEKVRAALAELIPEYSAVRTTRASASNKLLARPPN
jgi:FlaA1/EpsC-like NDP-sugar epimerase